MVMEIKDGRGSGERAQVDDHGRLYTLANMVSHIQHHSTYHQNAYNFNFETTMPDGSEHPIALLRNIDSANEFEVYDIHVSGNAAAEFGIYVNSTYTSGGAAVTPANLSVKSGNIISPTAYEGGASGDLVVGTTDEKKLIQLFLAANGNHHSEFEGGLVLTNTGSIVVKAISSTSAKLSVHLKLSTHATGTKL